jgi:hypothetical protein
LQAAADLANPVWTTLTNGFTTGTNGSGAFTVTQPNASGDCSIAYRRKFLLKMIHFHEDNSLVTHSFDFPVAGAVAPAVFAWGDDGHRTIGAMADHLIAGTAAAQHVHELLGEETLSAASVWADTVKGQMNQTDEMLQFKAANPNHSVSHYTDIPFEEPKYRDDSIGATNVDVVHAIPACILILQGKPEAQCVQGCHAARGASVAGAFHRGPSSTVARRRGLPGPDQIHRSQRLPGHYGDDQGANRLLFGGTNKLHFYWDTTVVRAAMSQAHVETPKQFAAFLLAKPAPDWKTSGPLLDWDRVWADESLALSAKVHDVTVTDEDDSQKDFAPASRARNGTSKTLRPNT